MKLFYILLILLVSLNIINAKLIESETQCISTFLPKVALSTTFKLARDPNNSSLSLYCENYPANFTCTDDYKLSSMRLKFPLVNVYQVQNIDLECFSQPNLHVTLENFFINENIYYSTKYQNLALFFYNCILPAFTKNIPNLRTLYITSASGWSNNIYLSYIKDITSFSLRGSGTFSYQYINDLVAPPSGTRYNLNLMDVNARTIPNMQYLNISIINIYLKSSSFDQASISNLGSQPTIDRISVTGDSSLKVNFPTSILSLTKLTRFSSTNLYYNTPSTLIDFSKMTLLNELYFDKSNGFTTDNIQVSPNGLPTSLQSFTMKNTAIKTAYPFYGLFKNTPNLYFSGSSLPDALEMVVQLADTNKMKNFDLSSNKLYGTISEKFCKVQNLNVYSNSLKGGPIPSCYYCHFNNNKALVDKFIGPLLSGNQFLNYDSITGSYPTCSSIVPDLKFENGKTYLFGSDLGFDTSYFTTSPSATWIVDIPSNSFYKEGVDIEQFDVTFVYPNQKFTVSALKVSAKVNEVYVSSSGLLVFTGSYFSNNIASIKAGIVGGASCTIITSTFYLMSCKTTVSFPTIQNLVDANFSITIDTQTAYIPITFIPDFTNRYLNCSENCDGKGYCDRNSGTCICKGCSKSSDHGTCDIKNKVCKCDPYWIGSECSTPDHYVSSVVPSNIAGGNVTLDGWYGPVHENLTVKIGNVFTGYLNCQVQEYSTNVIKCLVGAGSGRQNVNVTQNGHSWIGYGIYLYNETLMTCPNGCTNSSVGTCDVRFGNCICKTNYTGIDCGTLIIHEAPPTNTTVDQGSGSTNITNDGLKYVVKISKLTEISIDQKVVLEYELDPKKWNVSVLINQTDNTRYVFKQIVSKNTTVTYIIEEISNGDKNFTFADVPFLVTNGSIKLTIDIENYEYLTSLNTLQVQMISSVESIGERCIIEKAQINNIDQQSSLNYITISKEGKTLTGRFINRALSDGKSTYISSNVVEKDESSITVGLNLPHCSHCTIDPDFSVLVNSIKSNDICQNEGKNREWFLPVVIVVPVVGATAILIVSIVLYSSYRTEIRLKLNSFLDPSIKMNEM